MERNPSRMNRSFKALFPLFLLLLVGSALLLGGCGGDDDAPPPVVRGLTYTFSDDVTAGRVTLQTLSGDVLFDLSEDVHATGSFVISPGEVLPSPFLAVVTDITTRDASSSALSGQAPLPAPSSLYALVEESDALVRVTPLSSLVARYAIRTGKTLAEAEEAIGTFLELKYSASPSRLVPGASDRNNFSFSLFGWAWVDSGLSFDAFLDTLIDEAEAGGTHAFPGSVQGAGSKIFKWLLKEIGAGAVGWATGEGLGWVEKLIFGDPTKDIQSELDMLSEKMTFISKNLIDFEKAMTDLLRQMQVEADYNTMLSSISLIRTLYDDNLMPLPKNKDRERSKKEAEAIDAKTLDVELGLDLINEKLTAPLVGTSFYTKLATYLLGQVRGGKTAIEDALLTYLQTYLFLVGIQSKGLILITEHYHLFQDPEDVKNNVLRWQEKHTGRIAAQSEAFLDGVEMMGVFLPRGGCTMDYHRGSDMPHDAGGSPYFTFDDHVGDAVGASSQVVVRFLWDSLVADTYYWRGSRPKDYNVFFTFMKDRMRDLEAKKDGNKGTALPLYLRVNESDIPALIGGYHGTVNVVAWQDPGKSSTRAVVLRYIFRDMPLQTRFTLVAGENEVRRFNLGDDESPVPGAVGKKLLNSTFSYDAKVPTIWLTLTEEKPYATVPLFAWLPEAALLRNGEPDEAGGAAPLLATIPEKKDEPVAEYGIKATNRAYLKGEGNHVSCLGEWRKDGGAERHGLVRYESVDATKTFVRYGDLLSLKSRSGELQFPSYKNKCNYAKAVDTATLEPVPVIMSRFVDFYTETKEPAYPREGIHVFIKTKDHDYLREAENGNTLYTNGTEKDSPQRWTFRLYDF